MARLNVPANKPLSSPALLILDRADQLPVRLPDLPSQCCSHKKCFPSSHFPRKSSSALMAVTNGDVFGFWNKTHSSAQRRSFSFQMLFVIRSKKRSTQHMGGDMEEDITKKALMELRGNIEGKERRRSRLISKLIGARCEVEDVLLSSSGSSILSSQERLRLCVLMAAIDNIVRRVETVSVMGD